MDKLPTLTKGASTRKPVSPLINNRRWRRFRLALLNQRKLEAARKHVSVCPDCALEGKRFGLGQWQGHHIQPTETHPHLVYDGDNIEFLCGRHHRLRNDWEAIQPIPGTLVQYGARYPLTPTEAWRRAVKIKAEIVLRDGKVVAGERT